MWNWDDVFKFLVEHCDKNGGYYELSIKEGSQFKEGEIGKGWGEMNLRRNIFPHYKQLYPKYGFGLGSQRLYIWCRLIG